MANRRRKNVVGSGVNPSSVASPVYGSTAPTSAAPVGTSSIGRLGRLLKNGTRRVRMT